MALQRYTMVHNAIWFQLLWFIAIVGKNDYMAVLTLLLLLHLICCQNWKTELMLMVSAATIGVSCDALLTMLGVYVFTEPTGWLNVPWWLVGIWLGFGATLRYSSAPLVNRPWLFITVAAVAAPISYMAAARLGAVQFAYGTETTVALIGSYWACISPLLVALKRYFDAVEVKMPLGAASSPPIS